MKIVSPIYVGDKPLEKPNYGPGYIGFSYRSEWYNLVSPGIAWFTREEHKGIVPSRVFIIRDKKTIVEAMYPRVREHPLEDYLDDPRKVVFLKKPCGLTPERAEQIVFTATLHVGRKFDTDLFLYFIWRWLLRRLGGLEPFKNQPASLDSPKEWICSELASHCLKTIPDYAATPPLSIYHTSKIDPLMLFRSEIFEDWKFNE